MKIDLSLITFENDMFTQDLSDGSTLVLNKIDESFKTDYLIGAPDTNIQAINIAIVDEEGNSVIYPNVIGLSNDRFVITTDYTEYEGVTLKDSNREYCFLEVFDDE